LIPVCDENYLSMSSQRASRVLLSLMLVLAVAAWAEPGLAMQPASGHPAQCHARMMHRHQHALPAAMHVATSCCHQRVNSMPCCPAHPAPPPSRCGDSSDCCAMSSQPARPLAFLVSGNLLSQLNVNGPAGAEFSPPQQTSAVSVIAESPPFVKPVLDLKTDLRI
jgi:hypothetical protein